MDIDRLVREIALKSGGNLEEGDGFIMAQLVQSDGTIISVESVKPLNQVWIQGVLSFFPGDSLLAIALTFALESNAYLKMNGASFTCSTRRSQIILQKIAANPDEGVESLLRQVESFAKLLGESRSRFSAQMSVFTHPPKSDPPTGHEFIRA